MKEVITVEVQPGEMLQLHFADGPVGEPIRIPEGVASVTVTIRDTARIETAKARRESAQVRRDERRAGRGAGRGGGGGAGRGAGGDGGGGGGRRAGGAGGGAGGRNEE